MGDDSQQDVEGGATLLEVVKALVAGTVAIEANKMASATEEVSMTGKTKRIRLMMVETVRLMVWAVVRIGEVDLVSRTTVSI